MPNLDFSDVIASPEFQSAFSVVSTTRVIGLNGMATDTAATPVNTIGVVLPGQADLRRMDDGSRVVAFIEVYTRYALTEGYKTSDTSSRLADVITWAGNKYTVVRVNNYSTFGSGFIHASCDLLTVNLAN